MTTNLSPVEALAAALEIKGYPFLGVSCYGHVAYQGITPDVSFWHDHRESMVFVFCGEDGLEALKLRAKTYVDWYADTPEGSAMSVLAVVACREAILEYAAE